MSGYSLVKEFNSIKGSEFPWTVEVSKWAPQKAIQDLGDAFKRFFKKTSRYPKFKKKSSSKTSFYLGLNAFKVTGKYLKVSKLAQPIKMAQVVRFDGDVKSVVISRDACGDWYASFQVNLPEDYQDPRRCESTDMVGVDLGISILATLSTGEKIENPKTLKNHERKLKRLQRVVSRRKRGSSNRARARLRLALAHRKVSRIRTNYLHCLTSRLVRIFRVIGVEDLNVRGMVRNRRLAKSILDAAFREFRRQVEYKSVLAGSNVAVAARFFPSSKTCSSCGHKITELPLHIRMWDCPACGAHHDRDVNAAINLEHVAQSHWETLNACGGGVRPPVQCPLRDVNRRQSSMKQESDQSVNQSVCRES